MPRVRVTYYTEEGTIYSYVWDMEAEGGDAGNADLRLGVWERREDGSFPDSAVGYLESISQSDECPPVLFGETFSRVEAALAQPGRQRVVARPELRAIYDLIASGVTGPALARLSKLL